ncbi:MAG: sulfur carrier protein ThiS adenylyltransferase ThiF [Melioribacteraceae bacterium]|nr:sulfur carrier protein ThiS adenylyltransferase ThiF [Melioribacteraceae bacterium]
MNFIKIKERLKTKTVGVAGCGGLGSNAAVALARVGVGKLIIADFDKIEESNLNRQYFFHDQIGKFKAEALKENISQINPEVTVEDHVITLNPELIIKMFAGCDVIVEAFDKSEMKEMIVGTVLSQFPSTPLVCGVGLAGWGGNNLIKTEQFGNLYIVGDRANETSEENPPLAPRVGAVANMMANIVLELLLGKDK